MSRLLAYPVRVLVVESTWETIDSHEPAMPQWRGKVTKEAVIGSLLGWQAAGLSIHMAGDHARAGRHVKDESLWVHFSKSNSPNCPFRGRRGRTRDTKNPKENKAFQGVLQMGDIGLEHPQKQRDSATFPQPETKTEALLASLSHSRQAVEQAIATTNSQYELGILGPVLADLRLAESTIRRLG
ncbi:MAG: hypothetical protein ABL921_07455 [Pirellula sp.]